MQFLQQTRGPAGRSASASHKVPPPAYQLGSLGYPGPKFLQWALLILHFTDKKTEAQGSALLPEQQSRQGAQQGPVLASLLRAAAVGGFLSVEGSHGVQGRQNSASGLSAPIRATSLVPSFCCS